LREKVERAAGKEDVGNGGCQNAAGRETGPERDEAENDNYPKGGVAANQISRPRVCTRKTAEQANNQILDGRSDEVGPVRNECAGRAEACP